MTTSVQGFAIENADNFHRVRAVFSGFPFENLIRPVVAITSPASGTPATPGDIVPLVASFMDPDTPTASCSVRFERGDTVVGPWTTIATVSASTPTTNWNTAGEDEVPVYVRVVGIDDVGDGLASDPIIVDFTDLDGGDRPSGFGLLGPPFGGPGLDNTFGGN